MFLLALEAFPVLLEAVIFPSVVMLVKIPDVKL